MMLLVTAMLLVVCSVVYVLLVGAASPTAQMKCTLIQYLTVVGRQNMAGENDERVRPDEETQLNTPPLVIVDIILVKREGRQEVDDFCIE